MTASGGRSEITVSTRVRGVSTDRFRTQYARIESWKNARRRWFQSALRLGSASPLAAVSL